ncbi:hypothetical protein E2562_038935 [Oryza meyeriana var. granulata]|uniref:Uncharacterized protein n=1 Tax=Oryza meyeriana var. granulata TaxID=110450 RepID=A0A6G1E9M0_9ORYZ|nr:hypothetical protein E2562_038935 [Oryza meyeriana var. granulata]
MIHPSHNSRSITSCFSGLERALAPREASPVFNLLVHIDNGYTCDRYREGGTVKVSYAGDPLVYGSSFRLGTRKAFDGGGERNERGPRVGRAGGSGSALGGGAKARLGAAGDRLAAGLARLGVVLLER